MEACKQAAKYTGFAAEVIRRWAWGIFVEYFGRVGNIDDVDDDEIATELESNKGKHPKSLSLFMDEQFQLDAREHVRSVGYIKGAPNMTLLDFVQWVEDKWGLKVTRETARVWLHKLGFKYHQHSKGVYFDGHEREDVVEHRNSYLETMASLQDRFLTYQPHSTPSISAIGSDSGVLDVSHSAAASGVVGAPCVSGATGVSNETSSASTSQVTLPLVPSVVQSRPVIRIFHDESTFYSNADQSFHWTDGSRQVLKQKSLGQAIMVSDFIDEVDGFLRCGDVEARLYLEHKTEGYFTNTMFIEQVQKAIDVFEQKYTGALGLFIFDNAPSHRKKPADALNADYMNVKDGGSQPHMRDTEWDGEVQKTTLPDGKPKGMKRVLQERGVNVTGMNSEGLRKELKKFVDFRCSLTILEEVVTQRNHMCLFLPRFHCELNPIERCWCHAKKYTRAHCTGSIVRLRKIVPEGLATVSQELIARFFTTCNDYEHAYRLGHTCETVDEKVKKYKSHRRVNKN